MDKILNCINAGCNNTGCIPVQVGDDEWEPMQCEFCYREPNSVFNHIATLTARNEELQKLLHKAELLNCMVPAQTEDE